MTLPPTNKKKLFAKPKLINFLFHSLSLLHIRKLFVRYHGLWLSNKKVWKTNDCPNKDSWSSQTNIECMAKGKQIAAIK